MSSALIAREDSHETNSEMARESCCVRIPSRGLMITVLVYKYSHKGAESHIPIGYGDPKIQLTAPFILTPPMCFQIKHPRNLT